MNTADFYNAQAQNEIVDAKRQAYLDHIYETERAKYSSYSYPKTETKVIEKVIEKPVPTTNPDVVARLDRLENRIDTLYTMLTQRPIVPKTGDLFVFAPESANVFSTNSITLSDEQFKELINVIKKI